MYTFAVPFSSSYTLQYTHHYTMPCACLLIPLVVVWDDQNSGLQQPGRVIMDDYIAPFLARLYHALATTPPLPPGRQSRVLFAVRSVNDDDDGSALPVLNSVGCCRRDDPPPLTHAYHSFPHILPSPATFTLALAHHTLPHTAPHTYTHHHTLYHTLPTHMPACHTPCPHTPAHAYFPAQSPHFTAPPGHFLHPHYSLTPYTACLHWVGRVWRGNSGT